MKKQIPSELNPQQALPRSTQYRYVFLWHKRTAETPEGPHAPLSASPSQNVLQKFFKTWFAAGFKTPAPLTPSSLLPLTLLPPAGHGPSPGLRATPTRPQRASAASGRAGPPPAAAVWQNKKKKSRSLLHSNRLRPSPPHNSGALPRASPPTQRQGEPRSRGRRAPSRQRPAPLPLPARPPT